MSLTVIKAGICDTLQDLGRRGYQHRGINPGGVMDGWAAQVVNLLAGNDPGTAVIEMHFPAAAISFQQDCILVIGGADFTPVINGDEVPLHQPMHVQTGSELQFRSRKKGSWCYIAVRGGFAVEPWLGSCSTHLKAGAGGWQGRPLQKNDAIPFQMHQSFSEKHSRGFAIFPWSAAPFADPAPSDEIWIVAGNEWKGLNEESKQLIEEKTFTIQPSSDRMGYSIEGPALSQLKEEQLVSSAVGFGTIQLLPDGQLMILMADHQTTGGYPRIGHVVKAHLPKLAQLQPGSKLTFKMISHAAAEQFLLQQHRHITALKNACDFKKDKLDNV